WPSPACGRLNDPRSELSLGGTAFSLLSAFTTNVVNLFPLPKGSERQGKGGPQWMGTDSRRPVSGPIGIPKKPQSGAACDGPLAVKHRAAAPGPASPCAGPPG